MNMFSLNKDNKKKEEYQRLASELKANIKKDYGSVQKFSEKIGMNRSHLARVLAGSPTPYRIKLVWHLYFTGLRFDQVSARVTPELKEVIQETIIKHPDSEGWRGNRTAYQFFIGKSWTNTYWSEVLHGKRTAPSTKLMELCEFLEINIFKYL